MMSSGEADLERRAPSRSRLAVDDAPPLVYRAAVIICQASILILVVVIPWCFGGVHSWSHLICFPVLALGIAVWLALLPGRQYGNDCLPLAVLPIVAAIVIPALQLIPLDAGWSSLLSPSAVHWRQTLLVPPASTSELPPKVDDDAKSGGKSNTAELGAGPISIYPTGTRRRSALLIMAVMAFALGARYFRRREPLIALLVAITACGAALAFFGIIEKLNWTGKIYGFYDLKFGGNPFGPYVNRNSAAGFLNIALACSFGLLLCFFNRRVYHSASAVEHSRLAEARPSNRVARLFSEASDAIGSLTAIHLGLLVGMGSVMAGICASMSRGGIGSMMVGLLAACWALRRVRGAWVGMVVLGVVMLGAGGIISFSGLSGELETRMESLLSGNVVGDSGRDELFRVGLDTAANNWRFGSGLGTFRYAHQPYGTHPRSVFYEYAENQYLETIAEAGLPGFLLLLTVIGMMLWVCWRLLRASQRNPEHLWVGLTLLVALATQLFHAFLDFGMYMPGNFLPFALVCGAAAGRLAMIDEASNLGQQWTILPGHRWSASVLAIGLFCAAGWAWQETRVLAPVDGMSRRVYWQNSPDGINLATIETDIEALSLELGKCPQHAEGQLRLANLWIRRFRVLTTAALHKELPTQTPEQLWPSTDTGALHAQAIKFVADKNIDSLNGLRNEPLVLANLGPAWRHLTAARDACPLMTEPHYQLAAICFLVGDPGRDELYLEAMLKLAPYHPDLQMAAARLSFFSGRRARAFALFRSAWEADRSNGDDVMRITMNTVSLNDLLNKVFPRNPAFLALLAEEYYRGETNKLSREAIVARGLQILDSAPKAMLDPGYALAARAHLAFVGGDAAKAAELFRETLKARPMDVTSRLRFIQLLEATGQAKEAKEVATVGVQLFPQNAEMRRTLQRLSQHESP